jgi:hypothetical protein
LHCVDLNTVVHENPLDKVIVEYIRDMSKVFKDAGEEVRPGNFLIP